MKKIWSFLIVFICIGFIAIAQEESEVKEIKDKVVEKIKKQNNDTVLGWKSGGVLNLSFSQVSLTNWSGGGNNSISSNGVVSLFLNHKGNHHSWDNILDVAYGILQQGDEGLIKTDDKLDFTSKYGYKASKKWYYALLFNFKTQLTAGYNYPNDSIRISNFMAPGYFLGAIGMDFKPNDNFTAFISPATFKSTVVNDQKLANEGAYGVDPATYDNMGNLIKKGSNIRYEIGGYVRFFVKKEIMKNIVFQSKIDLFSNYTLNPQNIDVNWETLFNFKVNKLITATLTTHLIYDDDIIIEVDNNNDGNFDERGPRTQFKEVLGIGFSFKI